MGGAEPFSNTRISGNSAYLGKAFYLFYYAAMAALFPFLVLYYEQLGFSGRRIGLLAGIPPVLTLVGASLWGAAADATQRHKLVLCLAIVGAGGFSLLLSGVATFWGAMLVVVGFALFAAPIVPLADNSVLELLGDRPEQYGRVRLWGAIGWGAAAPLIGRLVEQGGLRWSFHGYLALMAACLLVALRLPVARTHLSPPFRQGLQTLLADRQWRLFLFLAFIGGAGLGFVHHFLFLHLADLGASRFTMGLALTSATLSELLFFFFTDRWLRRWGVRPLLIAAMLSSGVRLLAYSATASPWLVLLIQLLHGPSFAMM
jgi:MFS transporter, PPP family, 3-phenylpropionic acid transporter